MANWFDKFGNSIISGGSSLISGIFGTLSQNRNISKQIKAQQAENERAREYNLELAKLQNNWNIAQWNRENAYNDPSAYMARLKSAKLNPDLVYGGAQNLGSASSPSMTAGAPAQPVDMSAIGQKRTIGDTVQQGLRDSLVGAQIDVLKSQARKNNADAGGQEITNETLGQINQATFYKIVADAGLSREQTRVAEKTGDMLISQKQHFDKLVEEIDSKIDLNDANIANMSQQQLMARVDRLLSIGSLAMDFQKMLLDFGIRRDQLEAQKKVWSAEIVKLITSAKNESADNYLNFLRFLKDAGYHSTLKDNLGNLSYFYENVGKAEDGKGGLDLKSIDFDYKITRAAQYSDGAVDFLSRIITALAASLGAAGIYRKLKPPKRPPIGF
ncbi:hypothetical protein [Barnesiella intestinihominis]|uniref:hypothetical protein n=1 Tax=Barnesiella intestinihominis TaxID=487174 RepID=UPI0039843EE4